jgi:ketosteroid isomerase-like protein
MFINKLQAELRPKRWSLNFSKFRSAWLALLVTTLIVAAFAATTAWRVLGYGGEEREKDRAAILAVLNAQQTAWNRGDVDTFLEGYWRSPELSFSGSGGITRGWEGVRERYKKRYVDRTAMGQLEFSELEFHFLGPDAALVLGHWHLKREIGDIVGVFTLVWQRFPEGWKIIHDHTSQVLAR